MGYTTDFNGSFKLNKKLDTETLEFLKKFNETRRMKRRMDAKYGIDGEFFVDAEGPFGQDRDDTIVDYNRPPSTQPSLWCQWCPADDGSAIVWDGGEKFYEYVPWIKYVIVNFLAPKGYVLNGEVEWVGEDSSDRGIIEIVNNVVRTKIGKISFEYED